jgi:hypothetical protein
MATDGIRGLVGKRMSKDAKFMGDNIKINKLSVSEVLFIQTRAKVIADDENEGFEILKTVIRSSVDGANDLSDDDFNNFPLDELSKLSNEIMKFSGIGEQAGK